MSVDAPRSAGKVYLPGSFNPLHEGHKAMMQAALKRAATGSGGEVEGCFELAAVNADKVRAYSLLFTCHYIFFLRCTSCDTASLVFCNGMCGGGCACM